MNRQPDSNLEPVGAAMGDADATLRLVARLAAPDGLEDRVKAGLRRRPSERGIGAWSFTARNGWMQSSWLRGAAAAAIVALVAGGSWEVYSHVQLRKAQIAIPHVGRAGGFSSANAMRTPKTLDVPMVTQAARPKKGCGENQSEAQRKRAANR